MNDEGNCRTAPATLGQLSTEHKNGQIYIQIAKSKLFHIHLNANIVVILLTQNNKKSTIK